MNRCDGVKSPEVGSDAAVCHTLGLRKWELLSIDEIAKDRVGFFQLVEHPIIVAELDQGADDQHEREDRQEGGNDKDRDQELHHIFGYVGLGRRDEQA